MSTKAATKYLKKPSENTEIYFNTILVNTNANDQKIIVIRANG